MFVLFAQATPLRAVLATILLTAAIVSPVAAQRNTGRVSTADFGEFGAIYTVDLSDDGSQAIFAGFGEPDVAYVIERGPHGWGRSAVLPAGWSLIYGVSVAISDDVAVVCAPEDDSAAGWLSGSARVYERDASGWVLTQELAPHDAAPEDAFGTSVAIDDDRLVVAASHALARYGDGAGAAYVFERDADGWGETRKLEPSSPGWSFGSFGYATAVQGDTVVLGSPGSGDVGTLAGSAFVFERGTSGWTEVAQLFASDATPNRRFGSRVAVDGDRMVVGSGSNAPAVYVFERTDAGWVETAKLALPLGDHSSGYGSALSLRGDRVLVGARNDGVAHLFEYRTGSWNRSLTIGSPDGLWGFGTGIVLGDGMAVIAASGTGLEATGAAYVFELE